jgi:hypothetical protein
MARIERSGPIYSNTLRTGAPVLSGEIQWIYAGPAPCVFTYTA